MKPEALNWDIFGCGWNHTAVCAAAMPASPVFCVTQVSDTSVANSGKLR